MKHLWLCLLRGPTTLVSSVPFTSSHWKASNTRRSQNTRLALPSSKKSTTSVKTNSALGRRSKLLSNSDTSTVPSLLNLGSALHKRSIIGPRVCIKILAYIDHGQTRRFSRLSSSRLLFRGGHGSCLKIGQHSIFVIIYLLLPIEYFFFYSVSEILFKFLIYKSRRWNILDSFR